MRRSRLAWLLIEAAGGNPNLVRILKLGKPRQVSAPAYSRYGDDIAQLISDHVHGQLSVFVARSGMDERSFRYMRDHSGMSSPYMQSSMKPGFWFQTSWWKPTGRSKKIPIVWQYQGKGDKIINMIMPEKWVEYAIAEMARYSSVARQVLEEIESQSRGDKKVPKSFEDLGSVADILILRDENVFNGFIQNNKAFIWEAIKRQYGMVDSLPGGFEANKDDLFQELTLKLWNLIHNDGQMQKLSMYDNTPEFWSRFARLVMVSLINQARDYAKLKHIKERERQVSRDDIETPEDMGPSHNDPEYVDMLDVIKKINDFRLSLKGQERETFDYLVEEMADRGEMTHGFKRRLQLALDLPRPQMATELFNSVHSKIMENGLETDFVKYVMNQAQTAKSAALAIVRAIRRHARINRLMDRAAIIARQKRMTRHGHVAI